MKTKRKTTAQTSEGAKSELDPLNRLLTRSQLAETHRISLVTVDNWTRRGLPYEFEDGKKLYRFGEASLWIACYQLRSENRVRPCLTFIARAPSPGASVAVTFLTFLLAHLTPARHVHGQ